MRIKFGFVTDISIISDLDKHVFDNGVERWQWEWWALAVFIWTMKLNHYTILIPKSYSLENIQTTSNIVGDFN